MRKQSISIEFYLKGCHCSDFEVELASSAALLGHVVHVVRLRCGVGVVPVVVRDTREALWSRGRLLSRGRLTKHGTVRDVIGAGVLFR